MPEDGEFSHYSEDDVRRLYPILRAMAGERMAFERKGDTLQPTALAHEAWLRMGSGGDPSWKNTAHFFTAAAETMRRILIDRARRRKSSARSIRRGHRWYCSNSSAVLPTRRLRTK